MTEYPMNARKKVVDIINLINFAALKINEL